MRSLNVRCDHCGQVRPPRPAQPPTWWSLEDLGKVTRTGPLDFCSLACLGAFVAEPVNRAIYHADFVAPPAAPLEGRYSVIRSLRRVRVWRWLLQVLIVRVR